MISLSITMIVKNEELTLKRILSSLSFADEIIIVDTGSSDHSLAIARAFTDKVFIFNWVDDFSKARNFAISKASKDYFMWLDADDYITIEDQEKLKNLKSEIKDEDIILLPYQNGDLSFYRERIIKRKDNYFQGRVHEAIPLKGKLKFVNIPIYHKKEKQNEKERNLKIYRLILKERKLNARELYYYSNELKDNNYLNEAKNNYLLFLQMDNALRENKMDACLKLSQIYKNENNPILSDEYLFKSCQYGINTPNQVFEIIKYYFAKKDYQSCLYFSFMLLNMTPSIYAFSSLKDKDYYAYIYLGLAYYFLNNKEKALYYNDLALKVKENDALALNNKKFYQ